MEHWFLVHEEECSPCAVTVGELAYGIAKLEQGARRAALAAQLAEWRVRFSDRTHSFGVSAAMIYGDLLAAARASGRPMSVPDAQIAAIAAEQGAAVATRNLSDFATTGLELINPWG